MAIQETGRKYGAYLNQVAYNILRNLCDTETLHHTEDNITFEELKSRVGGDFMDEESLSWAYIYEDGYFGAESEVELSGCGMTSFQFTRSVKGTFNDVTLNIGQIGEFVDWQYIAVCGEPVLLALGPYKALIFADYEECFIFVNVLLGSEEGIQNKFPDQIDDIFRIYTCAFL